MSRNQPLSDEAIIEQAKMFSRASGGQDGFSSSFNTSWLQKFKQKHGLGSGKLRRASETSIPDSARMTTTSSNPILASSKDINDGDISPKSPVGGPISPLSRVKSEEDLHSGGLGLSFGTYRPVASQSAVSLSEDMRDPTSSVPGSAISPTAPFQFSPESNAGGFQGPPEFPPREKRSNTFPSLNIDFSPTAKPNGSLEPSTPHHPHSAISLAPSSSNFNSPATEVQATPFCVDSSRLNSPPALHRSSSNPNMAGRAAPTAAANQMDTSPVSPSPEEARRAANTLLNYIQSMSSAGQFDQTEYMTVVQLTKKLHLHQLQHQAQRRPSMGGLSRIPEGDGEMPGASGLMINTR